MRSNVFTVSATILIGALTVSAAPSSDGLFGRGEPADHSVDSFKLSDQHDDYHISSAFQDDLVKGSSMYMVNSGKDDNAAKMLFKAGVTQNPDTLIVSMDRSFKKHNDDISKKHKKDPKYELSGLLVGSYLAWANNKHISDLNHIVFVGHQDHKTTDLFDKIYTDKTNIQDKKKIDPNGRKIVLKHDESDSSVKAYFDKLTASKSKESHSTEVHAVVELLSKFKEENGREIKTITLEDGFVRKMSIDIEKK